MTFGGALVSVPEAASAAMATAGVSAAASARSMPEANHVRMNLPPYPQRRRDRNGIPDAAPKGPRMC